MPIYMTTHKQPDPLEMYKRHRVVQTSSLKSRLLALWRILTKRNFILINYKLGDSPEGVVIYTKALIRTDYNTLADYCAIYQQMLQTREGLQELDKKLSQGS